ncbi:MAG: restriction endonuclease subunit S [Phycisphaerales bacterium JB052]
MFTRTTQLDQIAEVFSGHYEKGASKDEPSGTHRLVFIGSIDPEPGHRLLRDRCPRFTPTKDPGHAVLRRGDLVIPARGERHDIALIDESPDRRPIVAASFLHVIRVCDDDADPGYLAWWLNQPPAQAALRDRIRGTKIPFLSLKAMRALETQLPPLDIQRRIAEFHTLAIRESQIMTDLRDSRSQLNNALALQVATGELA